MQMTNDFRIPKINQILSVYYFEDQVNFKEFYRIPKSLVVLLALGIIFTLIENTCLKRDAGIKEA